METMTPTEGRTSRRQRFEARKKVHMTHRHGGMRGGRRGRGGRARVGRGDVRAAILALLAEEPMHGYQIMQELEDRSNGVWQPSPGSIYPTLQLLTDEGLVISRDDEGRKVFELTDAGRDKASEAGAEDAPWERLAGSAGFTDLRQGVFAIGSATKQIARTGTEDQAKRAAEILAETRQRLYQLLAE